MKRLIKKASNNPMIRGIMNLSDKSNVEQSMFNIVKNIAGDIVNVDDNLTVMEIYEEVVKYLTEDVNYISEHLDIPDELVDTLNSLDSNQTVELNNYLIDEFDITVEKAIEEVI